MDTNIPSPPRLVRTLSEHHWQAAKHELGENSIIDAGTSYDVEDGSVLWKYYIVKRGNIVEKHTVSERYNIHDISIIVD